MKIILANGTELNPFTANGGNRFMQGANRDCLTFTFPETEGLEKVDSLFTASACESITVIDGENEFIHKGYTVRAELAKKPVVVTPATLEADEVYENRIVVSMGQRTYQEGQIASLTDTVDILVMESLLGA